jgi:DNA-binding transcriptional ArsR family regulator
MDADVSGVAAAIGEPARARMLYCLMDGHARTGTELAVVAGVSPSTASVHLTRLKDERLVKVQVQGKHRYYSLAGTDVAAVLEGLQVIAGGKTVSFKPTTPAPLRAARTCYDHMAGALGVEMHDRLQQMGWLLENSRDLTAAGLRGCEAMGVDVGGARAARRRFAYPCLDWSERRAHLGGSLAAALFGLALRKRWVAQELDSRALQVTSLGRRELASRFDVKL